MKVHIPETVPLDDAEIRRAEFQLKCILPDEFRAFVAKHDGAVPQSNSFCTADNQSGVARFISISSAATIRQEIDGFPTRAIPIAEDDCGNYVWLHSATGEVFFWDHESTGGGEKIADGFVSFLERLEPFDPGSVRLKSGQVKRVWVDPNFKPEFD